ncbi:MAG: potassium channel protein [Proteobacteria bacterium]|nr:potassium channel protein [Pseudomonadota bacterium]MBU4469628.1 potassium channel protein [Pseudomonadota bacterium]MCG2753306.1 potassium channel protein [Desulfobacteraceae bacterium]
MESTQQLKLSLLLFLAVIIIGTMGYMAIEGWNFIDAFYMAVITVTTVGFKEVHEISTPGRIFTVFFVFSGVGFSLYVAGAFVQFLVEGNIRSIMGRRRLDKNIDRLKDHYIICGYGRIGRVLCRNLIKRKPVGIVAIESDPSKIPELDEDKLLYIFGNASDESTLIKAGIQRAKALVAVLATDVDNVFLVLTARQLAPQIHIVARASYAGAESKLKAAGANSVESPYELGARSMAQRIIRPTVTNFLDLVAYSHSRKDIQMEEIPVNKKSKLVNVMLKDSGIRQLFNLIIIAIKKPDGSMKFNPSFESIIHEGDTLIAVGEDDNLKKLEEILNPA